MLLLRSGLTGEVARFKSLLDFEKNEEPLGEGDRKEALELKELFEVSGNNCALGPFGVCELLILLTATPLSFPS